MGLPQGMSGEEDLERVWRVKCGEWRQEAALVRLIVLLLTKKTCHCEPVRTLAWQSVLLFAAGTLSEREKGNGLPRRASPSSQ